MYSFESRVRYSESDNGVALSLVSLINYLQDSSTFHCEEAGHGLAQQQESGIAWFITAWQIEISRLPRFCENIKVSTWCHTMAKALASRNFTIENSETREQLVRADSLWFAFDTRRGRPVHIPESGQALLSDDAPLNMPKTERRLPVEGEPTPAPAILVGEHHLDTNRHVNNAQYVAMAVSALTAVLGEGEAQTVAGRLERICVQYRKMALLGETLEPTVYEKGNAYTVVLRKEEEDSAIVRLELRQ